MGQFDDIIQAAMKKRAPLPPEKPSELRGPMSPDEFVGRYKGLRELETLLGTDIGGPAADWEDEEQRETPNGINLRLNNFVLGRMYQDEEKERKRLDDNGTPYDEGAAFATVLPDEFKPTAPLSLPEIMSFYNNRK